MKRAFYVEKKMDNGGYNAVVFTKNNIDHNELPCGQFRMFRDFEYNHFLHCDNPAEKLREVFKMIQKAHGFDISFTIGSSINPCGTYEDLEEFLSGFDVAEKIMDDHDML